MMEPIKYKNWLLRRVVYPTWKIPMPTMGASDVSATSTLETVERVEAIYESAGVSWWPTLGEIMDAIAECETVYGVRPDVVVAGFPSAVLGVEVR